MGDAGITSSSLNTFFDAFAFHANFLTLIADNQRKGCADQPKTTINGPCKDPQLKHGSVPDVTPFATSPYGANPGTVDWQVAYPTIARRYNGCCVLSPCVVAVLSMCCRACVLGFLSHLLPHILSRIL
jgi:hypothetical protein